MIVQKYKEFDKKVNHVMQLSSTVIAVQLYDSIFIYELGSAMSSALHEMVKIHAIFEPEETQIYGGMVRMVYSQ